MKIDRLKHLLIACLLMVPTLSMQAQRTVQYLQYEDLKRYHFGFLVGLHTQDLIMEHSGTPDENGERWYGSVPAYTPGFTVGVLGDLRLADFLSLRLSPTIHFGSKDMMLVGDVPGTEPLKTQIRSNYFMLPLSIRYRGARTNNYRPYLMTGVSAGLDMGRDKTEPILLKAIHPYLEFGVGCDVYLPFFRLVPELKFCLGLSDVFDHERNDQDGLVFQRYTNAFDRITSRMLVFSLQFE